MTGKVFSWSIVKNGVDKRRRLKGAAFAVVAVALLLNTMAPAAYASSEVPGEPYVGKQEVEIPVAGIQGSQQGRQMSLAEETVAEAWVARYDGPASGENWNRHLAAVDGSAKVYITGESQGIGNLSDYAMMTYGSAANETWGTRYGSLALEGSGSISGFVYEEDGVTPIERATVKVQDWDEEQPFQFVGESTTNASGAYVISGLAAGDYFAVAYATGRAYELYHDTYDYDEATPVSVTEGEDTPDINFSLGPGGTISGTITSADSGAPLSQVSVLAAYADDSPVGNLAFSDPSGNYTITNLPYGIYIVLSPSPWRYGSGDDGYLIELWQEKTISDDPDTVTVSEGVNPTGIDFTLEVGGSISGVVEDEAGDPIAGAWVDASDYDSGDGYGSSETAEDGSYTIPALPSGSYRVEAEASGYVREYYDNVYHRDEADIVTVTAPDDTPNIDFSLEVGGTISGHVYQEDGVTPIPNLHVFASDYDTNVWTGGTNTDEDGSYSLLLPTGTYRVRTCASCSGLPYVDEFYDDVYDWNAATPVSVTAPKDTPNIDFILEATGTISGHVYQEDGVTPIEGATVRVQDWDEEQPFQFVGESTTNASGAYVISGLAAADYFAVAYATGRAYELYHDTYDYDEATPVSVTEAEDTPDINFSLGPGGTISGTITSADSGAPLSQVSVLAAYADDSPVGNLAFSDDGDYKITNLPYGTYGVLSPSYWRYGSGDDGYLMEFWHEKTAWDEADPVTVSEGVNPTGIDFSLEVGGRISGTVVDQATGDPLSDINVYAELLDAEIGWGARTDTQGHYTIIGLPSGDYKVNAQGGSYVREFWQEKTNWDEADIVTVSAPDDTPNIDFTLEVGGTISGHVYQEDGVTPIPNLRVFATDYDTNVGMEGTSTNPDGSYSLVLPTGTYRVRACPTCSGLPYVDEFYKDTYYYDEATPVSVTAPDDTPNIDFTLEVGGRISGTVVDEATGDPLSDINVYAELLDAGIGWGARTDTQGHYTIIGLPSGDYKVNAQGGSYAREYWQEKIHWDEADIVTVSEGVNPTGIDFTLEVGGTISGHVYQEDGVTPIPNLRVFASDYDTNVGMEGTGTDQDGSYSLVLPTGTYRVRTCASCSGLPYVDEFYDDVYDWNAATPVSVTAPEDTPNIDFSLASIVPRETIEEAIEDGVAWLAGEQNPDGSWGTKYALAKTGLAVLNLEKYAANLGYHSPFDPAYQYHTQVENGLNYIFANAYTTDISVQPAGNPDGDGDGIGVYFYLPEEGYPIYNTAIVMMAIAASNVPDRAVAVPGSPVDGWTYEEVLQDAVDYIAWAQTDSGFGRGGWNYEPADNGGERSDQSNSGWVTLGLAWAEAKPPEGVFGLPIPGFVRTELDRWIDYIQNDVDGDDDDGGADYTGPGDPNPDWEPWVNILKTGNLLQQMQFVGDTEATLRVQDAIDYLVRHWGESYDPGWRGGPTCYHSTYTAMKGLEALEIDFIDSIDWLQDFADALLSEQTLDGWWPVSPWDDCERILSTDWALLTLQKAVVIVEGPDLVIIDKYEEWVDEGSGTYRVSYTVKNRGNVEAPAGHDVGLTVDGADIEQKTVPVALPHGASYSDSFKAVLTLSDETDKVTVCADINGEVDELNEDNNCLTNWHPCFPITVTRDLPDYAVRGESFDVTIAFTAAEDAFNSIRLSDEADGGYMTVAVDATWCDPDASWANPVDNRAEYVWAAPYGAGTSFTAVYQVTVDPSTPQGTYSFEGWLEYYIGGEGPCRVDIGGDSEVEVVIPGDCDMDGDVDVFDLVCVKRIILGLDPPTPGADCDMDGDVDVFDLVCVKRIILGID